MADENTNLNEEPQGSREVGDGVTHDPTTGVTNSKSIVHDGVATFIIDEVSTDVKLKVGMIGCFKDSEYGLDDTGILKDKSPRPGAIAWGCRIGGIDYTFDNNGHCIDDTVNDEHPELEPHHLYIVASSIEVAEGSMVTGMTRSGVVGAKTVSIDSLTVRDNFAMIALEALIHRMDDPLECSTASCKFVTDKAYEYANAMMISSAEARAQYEDPSGGGGTPGTVDVPEGDLANNTEKLLNNIYKTLDAQKTQDKTQFEAGLKIASTPKLLVDNPENEQHVVDKFQVEGGGGGSLSYDDMPLLPETGDTVMTHVLGFATDSENKKYVGKSTFAVICNRIWDTIKSKIWTHIKSDVDSEITSVGNTNLASGGAWEDAVKSIADARIVAKVKAEALKS